MPATQVQISSTRSRGQAGLPPAHCSSSSQSSSSIDMRTRSGLELPDDVAVAVADIPRVPASCKRRRSSIPVGKEATPSIVHVLQRSPCCDPAASTCTAARSAILVAGFVLSVTAFAAVAAVVVAWVVDKQERDQWDAVVKFVLALAGSVEAPASDADDRWAECL